MKISVKFVPVWLEDVRHELPKEGIFDKSYAVWAVTYGSVNDDGSHTDMVLGYTGLVPYSLISRIGYMWVYVLRPEMSSIELLRELRRSADEFMDAVGWRFLAYTSNETEHKWVRYLGFRKTGDWKGLRLYERKV